MGLSEWAPPICVICIIIMCFTSGMLYYRTMEMNNSFDAVSDDILSAKQVSGNATKKKFDFQGNETDAASEQVMESAVMLNDMKELYEMNDDITGWLIVDDTVIDYPVMQTPEDEEYYLERDFQENYSAYGCLIMDTDSTVGSGTLANGYHDGTKPSTNLIVHGHNMKNGSMFGGLDKYRDQSYEQSHNIIKFTSLYEEREYEIVSVFLSQVYLKTQTDVFKYYQFFNAANEDEFNDFYKNIKELQLYDTGVTAEYGDEFITLSVCAYHVENGRLVVVAKRIK